MSRQALVDCAEIAIEAIATSLLLIFVLVALAVLLLFSPFVWAINRALEMIQKEVAP